MTEIINEIKQNWFFRVLIWLKLKKRRYSNYKITIGEMDLGESTGPVKIHYGESEHEKFKQVEDIE